MAWWGWLPVPEKQKQVVFINLTTLPIGPQELKTAFAVSENMLWFRAILQTLAVRQQEFVDAAGSEGSKDNPVAMAFHLGKAQGMTEVIADLQRLRKLSVSE